MRGSSLDQELIAGKVPREEGILDREPLVIWGRACAVERLKNCAVTFSYFRILKMRDDDDRNQFENPFLCAVSSKAL